MSNTDRRIPRIRLKNQFIIMIYKSSFPTSQPVILFAGSNWKTILHKFENIQYQHLKNRVDIFLLICFPKKKINGKTGYFRVGTFSSTTLLLEYGCVWFVWFFNFLKRLSCAFLHLEIVAKILKLSDYTL